jgi:hypothetical protein
MAYREYEGQRLRRIQRFADMKRNQVQNHTVVCEAKVAEISFGVTVIEK